MQISFDLKKKDVDNMQNFEIKNRSWQYQKELRTYFNKINQQFMIWIFKTT